MNKLWICFVPLAAVMVALLVFWHFAEDLHLDERQAAIYHAAIIGIAIVGAVRVLIRLNLGESSGPAEPSDPNSKKPEEDQH